MRRAFTWVSVAYLAGLVVALGVGSLLAGRHPVAVVAAADLAATVAVFAFSLAFRNSSFYDPYWSVAPIAIVLYWAGWTALDGAVAPRQLAAVLLVAAWGLRLTWNWARGWQGLSHEDWRYVDLRARTGRAWWLVSFTGVHALPTAWVFVGCLPLYAAVATGTRPLGWLDLLGVAVAGGSIWIEARADDQLRRFRLSRPEPGAILASGLWARSRHPNYFGEIGFWWGLFLLGLAADPGWWWSGVGAVSITLLFRFISLPMIEKRMLARRPGWAAHARRTPLLVPWPRRG